MDPQFTLFVVDDIAANRQLLKKVLDNAYRVEAFSSAEACLQRLSEEMPDMFLLDVDMPDMNGFTLCQRIRAESGGKELPILFVSAYDDIESRLAAYDAGGNDFVAKPFQLEELTRKVAALLRVASEKTALRLQAEESDLLATLVMSNLDEYAVLVKFMRSLNGCEGFRDIADAVIGMIRAYRLEGALQFRLPGFEITLSHDGEVSPLEASIISHIQTTGTIIQFATRSAYNYGCVSLLVSNMPVADPDMCGRLRDHLAIAVETVNVKLQALILRQKSAQTQGEIGSLLESLRQTVDSFQTRYDKARFQGSLTTDEMLTQLMGAIAPLAMTEAQEQSLIDLVRIKADQLVEIFDFGDETNTALSGISDRLVATLGGVK